MHVQRLTIENIRSLQRFDLDLRREESLAGWHVLLGDNGAGKSTVVRALALALMGQSNAHATRQDWFRWLSAGSTWGQITAKLIQHEQDRWKVGGRVRREPLTAKVSIKAENSGSRSNGQQAVLEFPDSRARSSLWGGGEGWFSASFGPFRRFTGGDREMDKLYLTHPRLARHLSAFGENVALGESLLWLTNLQVKFLEGDDDARDIIEAVQQFIDDNELLPHGARIARVTSERIDILDGLGAQVVLEDMSDGYRSILSLTLELIRLMFSSFDTRTALDAVNVAAGTIALPGVVAIDEIDAHLHPAWQQRIGDWFVEHFPETQFFVTTHSPIICRAARRGSVWLLPMPGSDEGPRRIVGHDLNRLIYGNILDAYGTELFGEEVTRSEQSKKKLEQLARLNRKRLSTPLAPDEQHDLEHLRATMPSSVSVTAASGSTLREPLED
jgi:energy-coupling factor transporter ATP-binding protein EcfA2